MPRPKRPSVLTFAPAHSADAIDEWKTGIEDFLEWANRARTGELSPEAVHADEVLTAFSEGRFDGMLIGVAGWVIPACANIRNLVRDAHWHLRRCPWCDRWLLAKAENRVFCRRTDCRRRAWKAQQVARRTALRELSGIRPRPARRRTK